MHLTPEDFPETTPPSYPPIGISTVLVIVGSVLAAIVIAVIATCGKT